jgi:hypothetical protein
MMLRKTLTWILAAGLTLAGLPLAAQDYAPDTVWGQVPTGATAASHAVLTDASGNVVATVPIVAGKFSFENVVPGQYYVVLRDAAGTQLARSHPAQMTASAVTRAIFDDSPAAAAVVATGGGLSTTTWLLIALGAAGITTAIVLATGDDDDAVSPTR